MDDTSSSTYAVEYKSRSWISYYIISIFAHIDFIKPICLPTSDSLRSFDYDGIYLEVAGWGKTENGLLQFKFLQ